MKKVTTALFACILGLASIGYGAEPAKKVEIKVFAAASLKGVMSKFEANYEKAHPAVDVILNTDSSGKLMNQIKEGAPCDIFFSAAIKQMDDLEKTKQVKTDSRKNVLNNQLVVVTRPESKTAVTGLATLNKAKSIALAHGSVPVGKYTRRALIKLGTLKKFLLDVFSIPNMTAILSILIVFAFFFTYEPFSDIMKNEFYVILL